MSTPAWTDPTTHVWATGEVVTAANLNTYVQQDLANINAYAQSKRYNINGAAVTATTQTQLTGANWTGIATFPEAFSVIVTLLGVAVEVTTGGAGYLAILDQSSANITMPNNGVQQFNNDGATGRGVTLVGIASYAANTSFGLSVQGHVSAGQFNLYATLIVEFVRGTI